MQNHCVDANLALRGITGTNISIASINVTNIIAIAATTRINTSIITTNTTSADNIKTCARGGDVNDYALERQTAERKELRNMNNDSPRSFSQKKHVLRMHNSQRAAFGKLRDFSSTASTFQRIFIIFKFSTSWSETLSPFKLSTQPMDRAEVLHVPSYGPCGGEQRYNQRS